MIKIGFFVSLLQICTVFFFFHTIRCQDQPDVTTEAPKPKKDCLKDENKPAFVPNLYQCEHDENCCFNEGDHSCCGTDVTDASIREQLLLWGCLIGILTIVGIMATCYFKDRYCCDGDPDDEDGTFCCCFKRKRRYKKHVNFAEKLYPDEHEKNKVDDPIFGRLGRPDDVPQFATIDKQAEKTAQYI